MGYTGLEFSITSGTSETVYPLLLDSSNSATLDSSIDNNMDWLPVQRLIIIVFAADPFKIFMLRDRSDFDWAADDVWSRQKPRVHYCRMHKEPSKINDILNRHWSKN